MRARHGSGRAAGRNRWSTACAGCSGCRRCRAEADVAALCGDDAFDVRRAAAMPRRAWRLEHQDRTQRCGGDRRLAGAATPAARREALADLPRHAVQQEGASPTAARSATSPSAIPPIAGNRRRVRQCSRQVRERKALLELVDLPHPALTVGRRFALAWEEAKSREGLIDFDDQIRRAAALLSTPTWRNGSATSSTGGSTTS